MNVRIPMHSKRLAIFPTDATLALGNTAQLISLASVANSKLAR